MTEASNDQPSTLDPMYASTVFVQSSGVDVTLIFSRAALAIPKATREVGVQVSPPDESDPVPVAAITMSPSAVKDMMLVLGGVISHLENTFGPIGSPMQPINSQVSTARGPGNA